VRREEAHAAKRLDRLLYLHRRHALELTGDLDLRDRPVERYDQAPGHHAGAEQQADNRERLAQTLREQRPELRERQPAPLARGLAAAAAARAGEHPSSRSGWVAEAGFEHAPDDLVEVQADRPRRLGHERVTGHARRGVHFEQEVALGAITHQIDASPTAAADCA